MAVVTEEIHQATSTPVFDLEVFLKSEVVTNWLRNFQSEATKTSYEYHFKNFMSWLWTIKRMQLSPEQILNDQNSCLINQDKRIRAQWAYRAIEFARDSKMPPSKDSKWIGNSALSYDSKTQAWAAVRSFFAYNDLELPTIKSQRIEQDETEEPASLKLSEFALIVRAAPLDLKSAFIVILHSGVRIGDFFDAVNFLWPKIKQQIHKKTAIIKINPGTSELVIEIPWANLGTKLVCLPMIGKTTRGKIFKYFILLGKDAIETLERYVKERGEPAEGEPIWRFDKTHLQRSIHDIAIRQNLMKRDRKLKRGGRKYRIYIHRIRKLMKTTCMFRNVSAIDSEFLEGRKPTGVDKIYDERHLADPSLFAAEFLKAEPILNILSNPEWKTPAKVNEFILKYDKAWKAVDLKGRF